MLNKIIIAIVILTNTQLYSQQWSKTYGTIGSDKANSVILTTDEGYLIVGNNGAGYLDYVWILKCNWAGDTLWTKKIWGPDGTGFSCLHNSNGNYIIAGYANSPNNGRDALVLEISDNGDILWSKTYGGIHEDVAQSIQQTRESGYIIAGYSYSFGAGKSDVWIFKTDLSGDTIWTRTYGGAELDGAFSIKNNNDNGFIVTGFTESLGMGDRDLWLLKLDMNGDTLWTKTFGSTGFDMGESVIQNSDGDYVVTGNKSMNVWLLKVNPDGLIIWDKVFTNPYYDSGACVIQTSDGGYIITGVWNVNYEFNLLLLRTNQDGEQLWRITYGQNGNDYGNSIQQTLDGGYIIAGSIDVIGKNSELWLLKTDSYGNTIINSIQDKNESIAPIFIINNYPNPFNSTTTINYNLTKAGNVKIKILDIMGKLVSELINEKQTIGSHSVKFDGSNIASGIYLYRIQTDNVTIMKKMILLK